jgi:hypothetical protein
MTPGNFSLFIKHQLFYGVILPPGQPELISETPASHDVNLRGNICVE